MIVTIWLLILRNFIQNKITSTNKNLNNWVLRAKASFSVTSLCEKWKLN